MEILIREEEGHTSGQRDRDGGGRSNERGDAGLCVTHNDEELRVLFCTHFRQGGFFRWSCFTFAARGTRRGHVSLHASRLVVIFFLSFTPSPWTFPPPRP